MNTFVLLPKALKASASRFPESHSRKKTRICAIIFTLTCGYRSLFPRIDVPRTCFFDTPVNAVIYGRLLATVAEVAWVYQFFAVLQAHRHSSLSLGPATGIAGKMAIIMAFVAEGCSWTNLITGNNFFAVVEQAVWACLFLVLALAYAHIAYEWGVGPAGYPPSYRIIIALLTLMAGEQAYEAFSLYWGRWQQDIADNLQYNSFSTGISHLMHCASTSKSIDTWASDAPW